MPLIIACAMFMQSLDSTILATSIPSIARALGVPTLQLHIAITAYLLALAGFLPLSGWLADRFGARRIFRIAIFTFTGASVLCGFATNLPILVVARIIQGLGGAMMVPVGRIILVRVLDKSELVRAMTLLTLPATVGPIVGPPLGGLITTAWSWPWIFWVNLPIGIIGFLLAGLFIAKDIPIGTKAFDLRGFVLSGFGLSSLLLGFDGITTASLPRNISLAILAAGAICVILYAVHANFVEHPILDLKVLRVPTLRASVVGGSVFRVGADAIPFLLPLLMQVGFDYTPLQSGLITFATSAGSFGVRGFTSRVLNRFGFRSVLVWSVILTSVSMAACALFRASTPVVVMLLVLGVGGCFRAIAFGSMNTLAFADVEGAQVSAATSFSFMTQRLSDAVAVAFAAFLLRLLSGGSAQIPTRVFPLTFVITAIIAGLAAMIFYRLHPDAGANLVSRRGAPKSPAGDAPS